MCISLNAGNVWVKCDKKTGTKYLLSTTQLESKKCLYYQKIHGSNSLVALYFQMIQRTHFYFNHRRMTYDIYKMFTKIIILILYKNYYSLPIIKF